MELKCFDNCHIFIEPSFVCLCGLIRFGESSISQTMAKICQDSYSENEKDWASFELQIKRESSST